MHKIRLMNPRCLFFLSFMLCALSGYAQLEPFLLLEKPGKIKSRIRFYVGDEIKWSFIDEKTFNTGVIKMISDSSFTTGQGVSVRIDEMDAIALEKRGTVKNIGKGAFYAIPPMILFSAANNAFNTGRSPLVDEEVWWISGIFLGITGISYLIPDEKKRNLESKWRIIPVIH